MTGAGLLLATLVTLPGTLRTFIENMPGNLAFMQVQRPYLWERHVTLKAFWRLLVQGRAAGEMSTLAMTLSVATALLLAAAVVACVWKLRRRQRDEDGDDAGLSRDRIISITILSMPLLMPFYFDYDLLLLAVPAVLTAREMLARGTTDRGVTVAWVALYAWLMVNPHVAAAARANGTVILLAALTMITMARAMRQATETASETTELTPLRRAA
jgi:heme/copper-type cytochrome/quinol oxidase subunit 2